MSKKEKATVVNNIKELNLEIDYDKLAEALAKALKTVENDSEKSTKTNSRFRNSLIRNLNSALYGFLAIMSVLVIISTWVRYVNYNDLSLTVCIFISVICCYFTVLFFLSCHESMKDDYDQSISLFNTNITLIALIVAIIALHYSIVK